MSSDLEQILKVFGTSGVAAAVVGILGAIATLLTSRLNRQGRLENERLKEMAELQKTIYVKLDQQKAETVDVITRTMPQGISREELQNQISHAVQTNFESLSNAARQQIDFVGELVRGYHRQALSQARVQFWFSVVAASVGFIYILVAAIRTSDGTLATVLNALPGVVIDAVAALFFKQAEQTRERATALYDRLRQDSQMDDAREMVNSIDDIRVRSLVKAQIALHMSGLNPKEIDLQTGAAQPDRPA